MVVVCSMNQVYNRSSYFFFSSIIFTILLFYEISVVVFAQKTSRTVSNLTYTVDYGEYTWKDRAKYYFQSLDELLHINEEFLGKCIDVTTIGIDRQISIPSENSQLLISSFPPDEIISEWWERIPIPSQMRVDPELCQAVHKSPKPYFNKTGCPSQYILQPSSPRCQTTFLKWACEQANKDITDNRKSIAHTSFHNFVLPEAHHGTSTYTPPKPWLLTAKNAFVSMCGTVIASCGPILTIGNCLAPKFRIVSKELPDCSLGSTRQLGSCTLIVPSIETRTMTKRIFVATQPYDSQLGHFFLEVLPRIVYHIDFLRNNPDVKILVGCDNLMESKKFNSPENHSKRLVLYVYLATIQPYLEYFGLSVDRLEIHKNIQAEEIYLPMEGGCQDPYYNSWQLMNMRMEMLNKIAKENNFDPFKFNNMAVSSIPTLPKQPILLVIVKPIITSKRRKSTDSTNSVTSDGAMSYVFNQDLIKAFTEKFNNYTVISYDESDTTLSECISCQVKTFHKADVVVGMHSSSLSNSLFMKPNSAVIEIVYQANDARTFLGSGPYSRLSAVMGNNHMIHFLPSTEYNPRKGEFNISRLIVHVQSFLRAIDFD